MGIREITETELTNIITVRIEYPKMNLRVIVAHAPQETDKDEERSEFFEEMEVQIERAEDSGDELLVVGDFNARLSCTAGNIVAENGSPNGMKLAELTKKYDMDICNFHENTWGRWTRVQASKDGISRSVLDYVLVQKHLSKSIKSCDVDEDKIFTPYREKKVRGVKKITHSDHCAIIVSLELQTGKVVKEKVKERCWKFTEDGMEQYKTESVYPVEVDMSGSSTEAYENWKIEFEKVLGKCFTKRKVRIGKKACENKTFNNIRVIIAKISKKGKIQRNIANYFKEQLIKHESKLMEKVRSERLKRTMSQLTASEKFSPVGYWKLKKSIKKKERKTEIVSSIRKENGVEVDGPSAIKEAYREEFEKRLANREPVKGWESYVEETNQAVRGWLQGSSVSSRPFTLKELKDIVAGLKNNKSPGVDGLPAELFKYAGDGVLKSLLSIYNKVKSCKLVPDQWNHVRITTIFKNKGSKKQLKYFRGIFLSILVSKIFEYLVKARIEAKLENVNLLQAGSRKNRAGPDNVFLLRACFDHFKYTKQPLFITAYDFEQAFDSLWLEDCIISMKNLGIEKEYLQLIYNMNKSAKVTVQTPFGETSMFTTNPIVKQGTVLGPTLCSASTGEYCGTNLGVSVGDLVLATLLYVDDIIDLSSSTNNCMESHGKAVHFANKKKIRYSGTKCFVMVMDVKENAEIPTLVIDEKNNVLVVTELTYLGDVFNSKGNNDGLIADRMKRGIKAMVTIAALMAEVNVGVHRISTNLLLYRSLFLSTILFNSQTWSNLRAKDIKMLQTLQLKFLKRIVGVSSSTANAFIFLELGVLPIEHEIAKRQIMYLHRILQLDASDPVRIMFTNLKSFHEAGERNWWSGVSERMVRYKIDIDMDKIQSMSKDMFSRQVRKKIEETAFTDLCAECTSLKKTANLQYQRLETQDYLLKCFPGQARTIFKWRSKTLNLKLHSTYKYEDEVCRGCGASEESAEHVVNCNQADITVVEDVTTLGEITKEVMNRLQVQTERIKVFLESVEP